MKTFDLDERRELIFPGNHDATIAFAVQDWIETADSAIEDHGYFAVALSGGSTPKKIFQKLTTEYKDQVQWDKVYLFWSDERSVGPDDKDSNYRMAMVDGGLAKMGIPETQIFRLEGEKELDGVSKKYAETIKEVLGNRPFDLIMLGMGDDGHTASLFPHTQALTATGQLVIQNHVEQKKTCRLTFTYDCINAAHKIVLYVLGSGKADILEKVLFSKLKPELYPSQKIGTSEHPATWLIDDDASQKLLSNIN